MKSYKNLKENTNKLWKKKYDKKLQVLSKDDLKE